MGLFSRRPKPGRNGTGTPGLNPFQALAQRVFVSLARLSRRYRRRRAERILDLLEREEIRSVLDVGVAGGQFWIGMEDRIGHMRMVGMDVRGRITLPHGHFIRASGLAIPFRDQSFDCVISNSVIEHVGDYAAQKRLADEIRRVSRRLYIVQVPAKHFPIEPHLFLPFVQYLPQGAKRALHRFLYGFDPGDIHLLTRSEVQRLFPEGRVETERVLGLAKSYTVIGRKG